MNTVLYLIHLVVIRGKKGDWERGTGGGGGYNIIINMLLFIKFDRELSRLLLCLRSESNEFLIISLCFTVVTTKCDDISILWSQGGIWLDGKHLIIKHKVIFLMLWMLILWKVYIYISALWKENNCLPLKHLFIIIVSGDFYSKINLQLHCPFSWKTFQISVILDKVYIIMSNR